MAEVVTDSLSADRAKYQDKVGGADGIRTHDPLNAIQVLFQLSYSPTLKSLEGEL